jgi:hypothetical protein
VFIRRKSAEPPPPPPEAPEDEKGVVARTADALVEKLHPHKHDPDNPPGPNIVTHERVLANHLTVKTPFGTLNINTSALDTIRPQRGNGTEVIQMVDGAETGVETVIWRHPLFGGWRIEGQTFGIYTGVGPDSTGLGARAGGFGLTKDVTDPHSRETVSVTIEFKLMHDDVVRLAGLVAPGAAASVADAVAAGATSSIGEIVGGALAGAVPIVSVLLAIATARWAITRIKDPEASTTDKALAVAHAIADAVRVVFPLPGVLANVALMGVSLGINWFKKHKRDKAEAAATPQTGPPGAEAAAT